MFKVSLSSVKPCFKRPKTANKPTKNKQKPNKDGLAAVRHLGGGSFGTLMSGMAQEERVIF